MAQPEPLRLKVTVDTSQFDQAMARVRAGLGGASKDMEGATQRTSRLDGALASLGRTRPFSTREIKDFQGHLGQSEKTTAALSSKLGGIRPILGGLTAAAGTLVAAFSFRQLLSGFDATASRLIELDKLAQRTGESTNRIFGLQRAARREEIEPGEFQTSLRFLQRAQADALTNQNSEAAKSFRLLGVEVETLDGKARPLIELFFDIADSFSKGAGEATKTDLALQIFGRSAEGLITFLNLGSTAIQEMIDKNAKLNSQITGESISAAKNYDDAMDNLTDTWETFKLSIGPEAITLMDRAIQRAAKLLDLITPDKDPRGTLGIQIDSNLKNIAVVQRQIEEQRQILTTTTGQIGGKLGINDIAAAEKRLEGLQGVLEELQIEDRKLRERGVFSALSGATPSIAAGASDAGKKNFDQARANLAREDELLALMAKSLEEGKQNRAQLEQEITSLLEREQEKRLSLTIEGNKQIEAQAIAHAQKLLDEGILGKGPAAILKFEQLRQIAVEQSQSRIDQIILKSQETRIKLETDAAKIIEDQQQRIADAQEKAEQRRQESVRRSIDAMEDQSRAIDDQIDGIERLARIHSQAASGLAGNFADILGLVNPEAGDAAGGILRNVDLFDSLSKNIQDLLSKDPDKEPLGIFDIITGRTGANTEVKALQTSQDALRISIDALKASIDAQAAFNVPGLNSATGDIFQVPFAGAIGNIGAVDRFADPTLARDFVGPVQGAVQSTLGMVPKLIQSTLAPAIPATEGVFSALLGSLGSGLSGIGGLFSNLLGGLFGGAGGGAGGGFKFGGLIGSGVGALLTPFLGPLGPIVGGFLGNLLPFESGGVVPPFPEGPSIGLPRGARPILAHEGERVLSREQRAEYEAMMNGKGPKESTSEVHFVEVSDLEQVRKIARNPAARRYLFRLLDEEGYQRA